MAEGMAEGIGGRLKRPAACVAGQERRIISIM